MNNLKNFNDDHLTYRVNCYLLVTKINIKENALEKYNDLIYKIFTKNLCTRIKNCSAKWYLAYY